MAEITRTGRPTISTPGSPPNTRLGGLVAEVAIVAGDAVYIKAATGKLNKATAAADDEKAVCPGLAGEAAGIGQGVTIVRGANVAYGTGLSPGTPLYVSGTAAGGLATTVTQVGQIPVAFVIDANIIHVVGHCGLGVYPSA